MECADLRDAVAHAWKLLRRAIYELCIGPIGPPTVQLDHLCRNRGCVNPYPVEPVTPKINTDRGNGKKYQFGK